MPLSRAGLDERYDKEFDVPQAPLHRRLLPAKDELIGREGKPYIADEELLIACQAAMFLGTPLLLTGEPGCGKTDFAFAIARWLAAQQGVDPEAWKEDDREQGLLECYVRSDTTARGLLYSYDAVRHFGEAQLAREARPGAEQYIELQPLGRALASERRRVVLIDEVDKAPRDLPNDLLRELDQGCFTIPEVPEGARRVLKDGTVLQREMGERKRPRPERPLVIITSNQERQLPDPFLRRCVFYHLPFPGAAQLAKILRGWFPELGEGPLGAAQDAYLALRGVHGLNKKPGTSELVGWVSVLREMGGMRRLERFVAVLRRSKREDTKSSLAALPWATLPGLSCLVKLRADLKVLNVLDRSGEKVEAR